jgi:outer membrane immunogenic protein
MTKSFLCISIVAFIVATPVTAASGETPAARIQPGLSSDAASIAAEVSGSVGRAVNSARILAAAANASAIAANNTGSFDPSAVTGAIRAGYNWQVDTLVYGVASDLSWFNLSGMRQFSANYLAANQGNGGRFSNIYTAGTSFASNSLFTLRGRLGFTETNLLPYVTGGLALTNFRMADSYSDNVGASGAFGGGSNSDQRTGWTIGGGLEWAVNDHWSVKGEYLFVDFGRTGFAGSSNGLGTSSDLTLHVARGGVNYKF